MSADRPPLRDLLLAALGDDPRRRLADAPGLEAELAGAVARGREAWPGLQLPEARFVSYLAARIPAEVDPRHPLGELQLTDLYLACACASGVEGAAARFERAYGGEIRRALTRFRVADETLDEVIQRLRHLLFVAPAGQAPLITRYSGRGRLRNWACVTAGREALAHFRRGRAEVPTDGNLLGALAEAEVEADPELRHLKAHYRAEFKLAFAQAVEALSPRERNLLRHQFIDGLNIDAIGSIYRVHRATAARWLARARKQILARTRQALMRNLEVDRAEFDSIMRLIQSRLDVTLRRFLSGTGEP